MAMMMNKKKKKKKKKRRRQKRGKGTKTKDPLAPLKPEIRSRGEGFYGAADTLVRTQRRARSRRVQGEHEQGLFLSGGGGGGGTKSLRLLPCFSGHLSRAVVDSTVFSPSFLTSLPRRPTAALFTPRALFLLPRRFCRALRFSSLSRQRNNCSRRVSLFLSLVSSSLHFAKLATALFVSLSLSLCRAPYPTKAIEHTSDEDALYRRGRRREKERGERRKPRWWNGDGRSQAEGRREGEELRCWPESMARVESSRVESSRTGSSRVEPSRVESSRVESSRVESSRVGSNHEFSSAPRLCGSAKEGRRRAAGARRWLRQGQRGGKRKRKGKPGA